MKRFLKIVGIIVIILIFCGIGGYLYLKSSYPNVAMAKVNFTRPVDIEHGKYLALHVAGCTNCHSPHNFAMFAVPIYEDSIGKGGLVFDKNGGLPGTIYSRNITPYNLGKWSDEQLFHTLTTGVDSKGEPLFPIMPYEHLGTSDPNDVRDIMAYIRTLKPIEASFPEHNLDFPLNLIVRTIPHPAQFVERPPVTDSVAYGKYLVNMASCTECHTQRVKGDLVPGMDFAGGQDHIIPGAGTVRTANITPDMETGIGSWTKEMFLTTFHNHANDWKNQVSWKEKGYQTIMPWVEFSGMTDEDLGAIYTYLHSIKPVKNKVVKFTPEGEQTAAK